MKPTPTLTELAAERFLEIINNTPKANKEEVEQIRKFTKKILKKCKICRNGGTGRRT